MLNELRRITSSEPYKSRGGMWVKEILITPWEETNARFKFELSDDDMVEQERQVWEVVCTDLAQTKGIPRALIPTTQIKIYDDHPLLWNLDDRVFFTVKTIAKDIPSLMGDLFIEHCKVCGNWIDFQRLYSGLPETLLTLRENQLAIPVHLQDACFKILKKYGVAYSINETQEGENGYHVLFFSNADIWPDEENFEQAHIMARTFTERRIR